jgi:hypothetical protein
MSKLVCLYSISFLFLPIAWSAQRNCGYEKVGDYRKALALNAATGAYRGEIKLLKQEIHGVENDLSEARNRAGWIQGDRFADELPWLSGTEEARRIRELEGTLRELEADLEKAQEREWSKESRKRAILVQADAKRRARQVKKTLQSYLEHLGRSNPQHQKQRENIIALVNELNVLIDHPYLVVEPKSSGNPQGLIETSDE